MGCGGEALLDAVVFPGVDDDGVLGVDNVIYAVQAVETLGIFVDVPAYQVDRIGVLLDGEGVDGPGRRGGIVRAPVG